MREKRSKLTRDFKKKGKLDPRTHPKEKVFTARHHRRKEGHTDGVPGP